MFFTTRHQQKFKTNSLYKRSREYFDIKKVTKIQQQLQISRRIPAQEKPDIDYKIQQNFHSTISKVHDKVQTDIQSYQKKYNTQKQENDDIQTTYTSHAGYKIQLYRKKYKTLDMNKMISRKYYQKEQAIVNQSNFCNFRPYIPSKNATIDFQKFLLVSKSQPIWKKSKAKSCIKCKQKHNYNPQSYQFTSPQIKNTRQKLIFDESLYKSIVDYNKYNKQKSLIQTQKQIQKDYDKIEIGQKMTKITPIKSQIEFYHGKTKWLSPQMDMRLLKNNQFYIKTYQKMQSQKIQWSYLKRKQDLQEKRIKKIMQRKKIKDIKGQICDQLYFRRN